LQDCLKHSVLLFTVICARRHVKPCTCISDQCLVTSLLLVLACALDLDTAYKSPYLTTTNQSIGKVIHSPRIYRLLLRTGLCCYTFVRTILTSCYSIH